eukprot:TRINITY_DN34550_c0_g1_i1.p1 TRINITY_DN34550_c0_g1~~TRINITY_DN34550_c0_g1_i1.p1  ORF type:complete len:164 (-),score=23.52 TRINITY_DN34550_c0_g1_i1:165-656(-)
MSATGTSSTGDLGDPCWFQRDCGGYSRRIACCPECNRNIFVCGPCCLNLTQCPQCRAVMNYDDTMTDPDGVSSVGYTASSGMPRSGSMRPPAGATVPDADAVLQCLQRADWPLSVREVYLQCNGLDPSRDQMGAGVKSNMNRLLGQMHRSGQLATSDGRWRLP